MKKMKFAAMLDDNFLADERDNVFIVDADTGRDWYAWISVPAVGSDKPISNVWLHLIHQNENNPSLNVSISCVTEEKLAKHINKTFSGGYWVAVRMDIKGVKLDKSGHIMRRCK